MNEINSRRYDLDWLRVIAIVLLLFYHAGQIFSTWEFHIKNNELSGLFSYWMLPLHYVRMPLLLFISGAGTYMALGKRTVRIFLAERFKRLVIPFLFGMVVLVPPMMYFNYIEDFPSYWDVYKSLIDFRPSDSRVSWYHLWFIAHLFVYSLLCIPILVFLRSDRSDEFKSNRLLFLLNPIGILLFPGVLILMSQILLRSNFPENFNGLAFFVFYLCFFFFGILCYSSQNVRESITKNRKHLLIATLIAFSLRLAGHFFEDGNDRIEAHTVGILLESVTILFSWFSVITIIGYGQRYLNQPHPLLGKLTEAAYPFYILHEPLLFAIGYYICQLSWSISAKFLSTCVLTFVAIIVVYLLFIRPFNVMRFLFGMKPKPRT